MQTDCKQVQYIQKVVPQSKAKVKLLKIYFALKLTKQNDNLFIDHISASEELQNENHWNRYRGDEIKIETKTLAF